MTDPNINEVDGVQFLKLRDWMHLAVQKEGNEISSRYDTMLENVNYHLSEATK